jgi:hypothetical protein
MGYSQVVRGHVDSVARGISTPNAQPNGVGLASVNPIFTWVRLGPARSRAYQDRSGTGWCTAGDRHDGHRADRSRSGKP